MSLNNKEQIRRYVVENFLFGGSDHDLSDDVSFLETGVIDSLGVMELVTFVEEQFNVNVADDEIVPQNFDSINNLASYIEGKNGTPTSRRAE